MRAKKRAQQAVEQLQERQAECATSFAHKDDSALFVLDTAGDKSTAVYKTAIAKGEIKLEKKTGGLSIKDQEAVERLHKLHDAETLQKIAKKGRDLLERKGGRKRLHGATTANFDLWSDEKSKDTKDDSGGGQPSRTRTSTSGALGSVPSGVSPAHVPIKVKPLHTAQVAVKVDVAKTGQSYHPDPVAHSVTMKAAVDVELRRTAAVRHRDAPLVQGLTEETRRFLVGDDDESSESETEESDNPSGLLAKRVDKLTRSQRNKQKRLRQEQAELEKRRHEKRLLNEVSEIPRYTKELKRKHKEINERKELVLKLKEESKNIPGKDVEQRAAKQDPIRAPTLPVALSMELKSSLRSLKPKGSLVQDRLHSMVDRNKVVQHDPQAPKPKRRKLKVQGGVSGPGFEIKG